MRSSLKGFNIGKKVLFVIYFCLSFGFTYCQSQIDVTEQTIKVSALSEEFLYFGFAEGDKIVFNFIEVNGKELKEIEIIEYPSSSKFSDYKVSKIENKTINVNKKEVYKFRLYNSSLGGRICKIKIQRIPFNELTKNFKTDVITKIKQDTIWNSYTQDVVIGYDTINVQQTIKELVKTEVKETLVFDKTEKVHSITNDYGNKTSIFFNLPPNQVSENMTTKVNSWAYWIGVGDEANQAWKKNSQAISTLAKGVASYYTTPLGALAIGQLTELMLPKTGEDVYYGLTNKDGKDKFMAGVQYNAWDYGKGIASYKNFLDPNLCQGTYYIVLSNDNYLLGINVNIKVIAMIETNYFKDKSYTEKNIIPKYEKKIFREPIISSTEIMTTVE